MRALLVLMLVAGLAVPVAWNGGFDAAPQWTFAGIACAAAAIAIARAPAHALRSAPVLILLGIGALSALSAAWTIAAPGTALRAGALAAGYAALALAAAAAAQRPERVAGAIALAAGLTALSGLVSVALFSSSFAERIDGGWIPEGPFGYGPALALVEVCALPVLLVAMGRARAPVAALAAAGTTLAAGVLVLAVSRVSLALAALVFGIALVAPERTVRASRSVIAAAAALTAGSGLALHELLGGWVPRHASAGPGRLAALILIPLVVAVVWLLVRKAAGNAVVPARSLRPSKALAAVAAVAAVAVAVGLLAAGPLNARRYHVHEGLTHGRMALWEASYHAMLRRPLQGYGAGSFLAATARSQSDRRRLTRFAHNLPLELGAELGILGLALGVALYAAAGRAVWRARGSRSFWLLGPAVAAFLTSNLVDWSWHLAGVGAVFALALGGLLTREA